MVERSGAEISLSAVLGRPGAGKRSALLPRIAVRCGGGGPLNEGLSRGRWDAGAGELNTGERGVIVNTASVATAP